MKPFDLKCKQAGFKVEFHDDGWFLVDKKTHKRRGPHKTRAELERRWGDTVKHVAEYIAEKTKEVRDRHHKAMADLAANAPEIPDAEA